MSKKITKSILKEMVQKVLSTDSTPEAEKDTSETEISEQELSESKKITLSDFEKIISETLEK
jgi:hypothetical protein